MGTKQAHSQNSIKLQDSKNGKIKNSTSKGKLGSVSRNGKSLTKTKCGICKTIIVGYSIRVTSGRTKRIDICSKCPKLKKGSTSFLEEFPEIAKEALDWDPSQFSPHNGAIVYWKCSTCSHIWPARISDRTDKKKSICPQCAKRNSLIKIRLKNNILTFAIAFPEKAKEANGWDPNLFSSVAKEIKEWLCPKCNLMYKSSPKVRSHSDIDSMCPHLHGKARRNSFGKKEKILFLNQTFVICRLEESIMAKFPDLVGESNIPREIASQISPGSKLIINWKCSGCSWQWPAAVNNRALKGHACPKCSKTGYDYSQAGFIYFLQGQRKGENLVQYGVTNHLEQRVSYHKRNGFTCAPNSEFLYFNKGRDAAELERKIKNSLRSKEVPSIKENDSIRDKFPGYTETFSAKSLEVKSLRSLIEYLDISLEEYTYQWATS